MGSSVKIRLMLASTPRLFAVSLCLLAFACGPKTEPAPEPNPTEQLSDPSVVIEAADTATSVEKTLFREDRLGINFTHHAGAGGDLLFPEMMGGGIAVFDADHDGDLDLYLVNGAPGLGKNPRRDGPVNRFFRQESDGTFVDATGPSGLGDPGYGTGVAVGDVNNDGRVDLYLANFGRDRLFLGRDDNSFEEVSEQAGILPRYDGVDPEEDWSSSVAFCDYDRDGFLDLYVTRYVIYDGDVECTDKAGRREYCGPASFEDRTDRLLHNRGDGTFSDVSRAAGIHAATGAGLGVVCEDVDDDGWMDFYVANDGDPNQLWINQRDGSFIDDALIMGTSVNSAGLFEAGMGVVAADFDNDSDYDLFVTHLRDETNTFYRNLGPGVGFEDQTSQVGLSWASTPFTGFGTAPFDLDLDGDLDIVVANGRVKRGDALTDLLGDPWNQYGEPNLAYANDGGSFRLLDQAMQAFVGPIEVSRALAVGDLNDDGHLDFVVGQIESPIRIYLGVPSNHHWLIVDARDPRFNRRAIGARVQVKAGGRQQIRTIQGAMSYLSSSDPRAHFGLGSQTQVDSIQIRWPDGLVESFAGVPVDQTVVFIRGEGRP